MDKKIVIRQETHNDFKEVDRTIKFAFGQNSEAYLVELLRSSEAFIPELSLVSTLDRKVIGHILFTRIKIIDTDSNEIESLALAPLAVKPENQNKGVGGQLVKFGLNRARELQHKSVIVLGHEHYYSKFGFVPANKWNIQSPFSVPSNRFMGIELISDGLKNVNGKVKYAKEFEAL
jgi:predicted N-acetyltransferase YhbS